MSWVGRRIVICKILLHSWFKLPSGKLRDVASLTFRQNWFQYNQEKKKNNSLDHYNDLYIVFTLIFSPKLGHGLITAIKCIQWYFIFYL